MHNPVLRESVYFLQADPRWGNDVVGGSGESLSAVGCTICAVAMAAGSLGYDVTPGELNARLVRADGYTSRGWLIWSKVSIPVVRFFLPGGIPHWVAIVGKSGKEYLVKDPLDSTKQIVTLSRKTKTIVSVRYVEKR